MYFVEISLAVYNVINRDFKSKNLNEKLLINITDFNIKNGKVYLSHMIDCFDQYLVS